MPKTPEKIASKYRRKESLALQRMAARLRVTERDFIVAQRKFRLAQAAYQARLHALMRFDGAPPRKDQQLLN